MNHDNRHHDKREDRPVSSTHNGDYIDTGLALATFCEQQAQTPWLGLDTEFMRVRTYYPQLCLVQMSTPDSINCIDSRAIGDMSPLYDLLTREGLVTIMHAARQDMELILAESGKLPHFVFDTQIAASFCGYGDQIGYAGLVEAITGVKLGKAYTRTDWCKRPLSAGQIDYAEDDVRYLGEIHDVLLNRLRELGREEWFLQESESLLDADAYVIRSQDAWRRVKTRSRMTPVQHQCMMALAAWREETAQHEDLPRNWVMRDPELIKLVFEYDKVDGAVDSAISQRARQRKRWSDELEQLLAETKQSPDPDTVQEPRPQPMTGSQQKQADRIMAQLKQLA
ncbi:MAG: ribonuclease D, partial [Gammaproteobacteria bacterium]